MKRILVAYSTMAGSTAEVAESIGDEISKCGIQVDVRPIREIKELDGYDGVVAGGPMIMGVHRDLIRFLSKYRRSLQQIPLAVFLTAMSLTQTGETSVGGVPVLIDEALPQPPKTEGKLSFKERYARISNYVQPVLRATRPAKPMNIAIFGGRLELGRLKWWAILFVILIIQASPGEKRNWPAIRAWAADLPAIFGFTEARLLQ